VLYTVVTPGAIATSSSAAYVVWNPIFNTSVGTRIRTYSGFFNDSLRYNDHVTFNVRFQPRRTRSQRRRRLHARTHAAAAEI